MTHVPGASSDALLIEAAERVIELLRNALARAFSEHEKITFSLSGGLDSSLLAKISLDFGRFEYIVAGTDGSIDIRNANRVAKILRLNLKEIEITEESVLNAARSIIKTSNSRDPVLISFEIPLTIVMKESESEIICTGQGADELFGGYAKYSNLSKSEFTSQQNSDIQKLTEVTIPLENRLALEMGKRIERPFMSPELLKYARSIDIDLLMPKIQNKRIIRQALDQIGMQEMSGIPKKAAQYGSGVSDMLKKIAKREGLSVRGLFEKIAAGGK